jgi:alpha-D-ribose 1-methylphosphonate 5-triphosphate synthase subunit PhnG
MQLSFQLPSDFTLRPSGRGEGKRNATVKQTVTRAFIKLSPARQKTYAQDRGVNKMYDIKTAMLHCLMNTSNDITYNTVFTVCNEVAPDEG